MLSGCQRILDIDLDFFVSPICNWGSGQRLDGAEYQVWPQERVQAFLENACGLDARSPVPGAAFEHHDEVFYYWRDMLHRGVLRAPFSVDHVDAHSDLGPEGYAGWEYIMTELLTLPVGQRENPIRERVGPSNYVAFAIANRWISTFRFVMPVEYENDMFSFYWADANDAYKGLQLKLYGVNEIDRLLDRRPVTPLAVEPLVPLELVREPDYVANGAFDIVTVCRSPEFTPAAADSVFELIKRYIRLS